MAVGHAALTVQTAGRRATGIGWSRWKDILIRRQYESRVSISSRSLTLLLNDVALDERITSVTALTSTQGSVVDSLTHGIVSAESWTGVLTPGFDASSVSRAVGVDDALWPAAFVGIADVIRKTLARCSAV